MIDKDKLLAELARIKPELDLLRQKNHTGQARFTELADRAFNISLHLYITELGPVSMFTAINEMAFDLGLSPATASRYLDKHITRRAHFELDSGSGLVHCRDCAIGMLENEPPADELSLRRRKTSRKIRAEVLDRLESQS